MKRALLSLGLSRNATILDLPCGYGRHALWLAEAGYQVVAADIDATRISTFEDRLISLGSNNQCLVVDAQLFQPMFAHRFDTILVVDFVSTKLLAHMAAYLKPHGFIVYETFSARGQNWQGLLEVGATKRALEGDFDILRCDTRIVGPATSDAETVKLIARRR